jgi:hypothetical protein
MAKFQFTELRLFVGKNYQTFFRALIGSLLSHLSYQERSGCHKNIAEKLKMHEYIW